jgi:hypothetical protein
MFECLSIQYGLILYYVSMDCKKIFEKILRGNLPPKSKVFWGGRDPERRVCSMRRLGIDWTGRQSSSKAGDSKVDLDTDADRGDGGRGEESPRPVSENRIAIPARRYSYARLLSRG